MAGFRQLVTGGKDDPAARAKGVEKIGAESPIVAEILAGSPAGGGLAEVPPATISFFMDGEKLKFKIFVKGDLGTFFGVVEDVLNPWGSINSAILVGDVSQKRHTVQNGTDAKVPY